MTVEVGAVGGTGQGMDFDDFEKLLGQAEGGVDEEDVPSLPHDIGDDEKPKGVVGGQDAGELAPEKTASEIIVEQAFGTPESEHKRLKQFLARDAKAPHLWSQLGDVCLSLGRKQEAVEAYDQAMALDNSYDYLENKVEELLTPLEYTRRIQQGIDKREEEEKAKEKAEETPPKDDDAENSSGSLSFQSPSKGDSEEDEPEKEESQGLAIFDPTSAMGFEGKDQPQEDDDGLTLADAMEQVTAVYERKKQEEEDKARYDSAQARGQQPGEAEIALEPAMPSPAAGAPAVPTSETAPSASTPGSSASARTQVSRQPIGLSATDHQVEGFSPKDLLSYGVQSGARFTLLVCALLTSGLTFAATMLLSGGKTASILGEARDLKALNPEHMVILGVLTVIVMVLFLGYLLAFHFRLIASSSRGQVSLPHWPSLDHWWPDIMRPILCLLFHLLVGIVIPARILGFIFPDKVMEVPAEVVRGLIVATLAFAYMPMAGLLVCSARGVAVLNPIRVIVGLFQTVRYYMFAMFFFAMSILSLGAIVYLSREYPLFGFPLDIPLWMFTFYMSFTVARSLGRLYAVSKSTLEWEGDE
jgi:tetratricopeptide (TPR) repeat protein